MSKKKHDVGIIKSGKSPYGSHKEMIISDDTVVLNNDEVLCSDENGVYKTKLSYIDSGLADPNRWSNRRS